MPAALLLVAACGFEPREADLLLLGGRVWTGADDAVAEAVAIRGGRILFVGSDADAARYRGPLTREIELHGRMLVPGFSDDHTHFISGGFQLASVDLRDAESPAEFSRRIGRYARTLRPGEWVLGGDWDHELWPGSPLPQRAWLDSLTRDVPVFVNRLDGHMALANGAALELAGVTRATADPPGGEIVRDASGEPTGLLRDAAMALVAAHVPPAGRTARLEAFRRAQAHALARGVTMVHDMGEWADLETYRAARAAGELRMRIYALVPLSRWQELRDLVAREGRGDDRLRWGGLKGFVDGSLGSTTAWFAAPYTDSPASTGLIVSDTAEIRAQILGADAAGLHVVVHAIGDRANDWLLDTYRWVADQNGERDRRFRVEHAQHLTGDAIARFAALGVLPSMQPYHAIDDGRWAERRIGSERIRTTYAFRSLLDADAGLMFGSDWTVAPIDPLLGIHAAVTRATIDGAHPDGWVPEQRIGVAEALRAYTSANAYGAFMERRLGTIEVGKHADLVVLSADLFAIEPARIPDVRVDYTLVGGAIVHTGTDR